MFSGAGCLEALARAWRRPGHGGGPRSAGQEAQVLLPGAGRPKCLLPVVSFLCEPPPPFFGLMGFVLQESWRLPMSSLQLWKTWEPQAILGGQLCAHIWAPPHGIMQVCSWIPLSGWNLGPGGLGQEIVTTPDNPSSYSPGDRTVERRPETHPVLTQCQAAQILLWLPLPWLGWSCEARRCGGQCSSVTCCPVGPGARGGGSELRIPNRPDT